MKVPPGLVCSATITSVETLGLVMVTASRLVAAGAVVTSLVLSGPAAAAPEGRVTSEDRVTSAASRVFSDRDHDARRGIDIVRVAVTKAAGKSKIFVTLSGRNFRARRAQIADTYFDTRRKDRGPEFRLTAFSRNDGDAHEGRFLLATERWAGGKRVHCTGASARFNTGRDKIRLAVPKSCLGHPKRIRVNTAVWDVTDYTSSGWEGRYDYAPAKKRWYPAVR